MHTAMKSSSCPLSHRWRVLSAWLTAAIGASVRQRGHTEALGSIVSRQARHGRPAGEIPSEAASVTGPNRMPNANHPSALRLFVCATHAANELHATSHKIAANHHANAISRLLAHGSLILGAAILHQRRSRPHGVSDVAEVLA